MRSVLRFLALALAWLLIVVTGLAIWLHYTASRGSVAIYATAGVPFAILPGVLAALLFVVLRRWVAFFVSVLVIAGVCFTQGPLWVSQTPQAGDRFTVVTANLRVGSGDVADVAAAAAGAQLVALQEVTPLALERVRHSALGHRFPFVYALPGPAATGGVLLGRSALDEERRMPNMVMNNPGGRTSVPGGPRTQVLAIHLPAPMSGHAGDWVHDMHLLKEQLQGLGDGPAIVAGDFNATWDHAQYRQLLTAGFADATSQAGAWWQPTFPTDRIGGRPLVAIDRVIVRGFVATSVRTFTVSGSDHRGVVVSLVTV
ncbi:endonuclease/exonuclease/phosphatase family protein [Gordonia sp. DT219]|uniref:endonuclease/exonuclease/phosphatase family protein n=1 Tax=Gordonia sp. DT219 TaxID=3416658 RepID=UPI003CE770D0